ncbi:MAG: Lrp/AsnC family transcriptional regulator [Paludibacteraceae bacterium]|nr:Lrp/AsnC family transcriptional regulator [Paludibacteraceae bacterium]
MANLDTTDQQILKELQQNSKLSTKELASLVNLTPTPVFERQKRLEKEGYIKKYVAVLDPEKLGYGIIVLCSVKLKQHTRENGNQFMSVINQMDQVTECYNISGEYDFMMKVYVRDMKDYQDFVMNKLGSIDCIGGLQSIFVIGEAKHSNCIPVR